MPFYESTVIVRPDASPQQVETLAEELSSLVGEQGGSVEKTEFWGLKSLAYRIKKNRKAHYLFMHLDTPASSVKEIERQLRLNEDVLRYLNVKVDELDPEPSAVMKHKQGREERGGRHDDRGPRRDDDRGPRRDDDRGPRREDDRGPRREDDRPRRGREEDKE